MEVYYWAMVLSTEMWRDFSTLALRSTSELVACTTSPLEERREAQRYHGLDGSQFMMNQRRYWHVEEVIHVTMYSTNRRRSLSQAESPPTWLRWCCARNRSLAFARRILGGIDRLWQIERRYHVGLSQELIHLCLRSVRPGFCIRHRCLESHLKWVDAWFLWLSFLTALMWRRNGTKVDRRRAKADTATSCWESADGGEIDGDAVHGGWS